MQVESKYGTDIITPLEQLFNNVFGKKFKKCRYYIDLDRKVWFCKKDFEKITWIKVDQNDFFPRVDLYQPIKIRTICFYHKTPFVHENIIMDAILKRKQQNVYALDIQRKLEKITKKNPHGSLLEISTGKNKLLDVFNVFEDIDTPRTPLMRGEN